MRTFVFATALLLLAPPVVAQQVDTVHDTTGHQQHTLPAAIAHDAADLYNAPAALRATGTLRIPDGQTVTGDVAILDGQLTLGGHITGRVVAINSDVTLERSARVDGDLIVVGGLIEGQERAHIGGRVSWYRPALRYHLEGERLVAESEPAHGQEDNWLKRWLHRHERSTSAVTFRTGGTYNRVSGLPVLLGPTITQRTSFGSVHVDALGLIRSADAFAWKSENLGHDIHADVHFAGAHGLTVGGRLFHVVDPVEQWHLTDTEAGLAAFLLHRDYRDYYNDRGVTGYVSVMPNAATTLTLSYSAQQWGARAARGPFTLLRNSLTWRDNPMMDAGRFHIEDAMLSLDTRNNEKDPWVGWYVTADLEHGSSPAVRPGPIFAPGQAPALGDAPTHAVSYMRGFLDLRRYNRVSPNGQLNVRVVLGGWLGGDDLPLERRLSLGGVGSLPGFDFRDGSTSETDVLQCTGGTPISGTPVACERIALAQVEYRGDLHIRLGGRGDIGDQDDRDWDFSFSRNGAWVVFADAGRGWLVGPRTGILQYGADALPGLGTFESDVGAGIDFDIVGLYLAKAISRPGEPVNFFIRLRHRF
ncbi:MAG TPA: hypothetical protein VFW98_18235 [Gemmatimonadaceae bacterium]|nr:hypothetical protein [Gemmatimonadaceae bacterium]